MLTWLWWCCVFGSWPKLGTKNKDSLASAPLLLTTGAFWSSLSQSIKGSKCRSRRGSSSDNRCSAQSSCSSNWWTVCFLCASLQSRFPAGWSLSKQRLCLPPQSRWAGCLPANQTAPSWATGCCGPRARPAKNRSAPTMLQSSTSPFCGGVGGGWRLHL